MLRAALVRRSCDGVAAATELRRSRCCDGAAQTSSVALILRGAYGADAAAMELMLRAALLQRSCDGIAAATESLLPSQAQTPSRSFCASRLDATRRMRSQHHFPPC